MEGSRPGPIQRPRTPEEHRRPLEPETRGKGRASAGGAEEGRFRAVEEQRKHQRGALSRQIGPAGAGLGEEEDEDMLQRAAEGAIPSLGRAASGAAARGREPRGSTDECRGREP
jgi:hypothetical protein